MTDARPTSSCGRIDPEALDPSTNLPAVLVDVNAELTALFNRLLVFNDDDLILEAAAHIEACTQPALCHELSAVTIDHIIQTLQDNLQSQPLQTVGYSALADIASAGDAQQQAVVACGGLEVVLEGLAVHERSAVTQYKAFDVLATLVANNAAARAKLATAPVVRTILRSMQLHAQNVDVQFGAACTLAGSAMNSPLNVKVLLECDAVKVLVGCFRNACLQKQRVAQKVGSEDAQSDWRRVMQWAELALRNVARCSSVVRPRDIESVDFGKYGSCVPVDELKWKLVFDCKQAHAAHAAHAQASKP
ncbi:hypothetical protein DIPPA_17618 [Diplonema papillatum]|nr:hypothetical protein DIPPA_17618 [Diplonema papillatum]